MPEEIRRKIYTEAGFDFSGSICPNANLDDLGEEAIEAFCDRWVTKSGNQRLTSLSAEQLLRDCEAITDGGITYAALVLFGKQESLGKYLLQAEIVFEHRSSEVSGSASQQEGFRVGLLSRSTAKITAVIFLVTWPMMHIYFMPSAAFFS